MLQIKFLYNSANKSILQYNMLSLFQPVQARSDLLFREQATSTGWLFQLKLLHESATPDVTLIQLTEMLAVLCAQLLSHKKSNQKYTSRGARNYGGVVSCFSSVTNINKGIH